MVEVLKQADFLAELDQYCAEMQVELSELQRQQVFNLVERLLKWNKSYNLTAIKSISGILSHHLLDSFSLIPFVNDDKLIDVGTGAGFPGLPLAIYYPNKWFALLDSNGKKVRFIQHVRSQLQLPNVQAVQHRVEDFVPESPFDICVSRAFSSMQDILIKCSHLVRPQGQILAMKGKLPEAELAEISDDERISEIITHAVHVPGLDAERHVIQIKLK